MFRQCGACGKAFPATIDYFYSTGRGALYRDCKACISVRRKTYYLECKRLGNLPNAFQRKTYYLERKACKQLQQRLIFVLRVGLARREQSRVYYEQNKGVYQDRQRRHRQRIREVIDNLKRVPCADCGRSYPACVMDFDHRDPKKKTMNLSMATRRGWSITRVVEEASKCDVVCANCHRLRTFMGRWLNAENTATTA